MIRELLIAVFFFFGPALLMLMLRNLLLLLLIWAKKRQQKAREPKIIDITPVSKDRTPRWFYIVVVVVSLVSAVTVFLDLQQGDAFDQNRYVPAHMDDAGNIVTGDWKDK